MKAGTPQRIRCTVFVSQYSATNNKTVKARWEIESMEYKNSSFHRLLKEGTFCP
jgi:hypothetical protein